MFGDKSTNVYLVDKSTYQKLLIENIIKEYKKSDSSIVTKVDKKAEVIAKSINMDHKIEKFARNNAFITFKDYKDNFENNIQCRLINPAKSQVYSRELIITSEKLHHLTNGVACNL